MAPPARGYCAAGHRYHGLKEGHCWHEGLKAFPANDSEEQSSTRGRQGAHLEHICTAISGRAAPLCASRGNLLFSGAHLRKRFSAMRLPRPSSSSFHVPPPPPLRERARTARPLIAQNTRPRSNVPAVGVTTETREVRLYTGAGPFSFFLWRGKGRLSNWRQKL